MTEPRVVVPELCRTHLSLLVHGAGFKESDPWRALTVAAQIVLFQSATADAQTWEKLAGDLTRIGDVIGCLGCYKPDTFGEIVEAARSGGVGAIKAIGDRIVAAGKK